MTAPEVSDPEITDDRGRDLDAEPGAPRRRSLRWILPTIPLLVAIGGFAIMTAREPDAGAPMDLFEVDIDTVSTDRLTAVLEMARVTPDFSDEVPGLVLVLAERHFTAGAYDLAFERYAEVVEHPESSPPQFSMALSRLAWIGWLSNGDTAAALTTLDQAVRIDPDNAETVYIRGQVLWCGADDTAAATAEFERVLNAPDLTAEVRAQVTGDLEAVRAGERCG